MGERRGGAHRAVVRAPSLGAHLGEGVEEEDDVGVPLRVLLVHPERAAQRGRAPVDAPHPVARLPLAEVGELDPLAAGPRDLVAGEDLRLERRDERAERLLARVDAERAAARPRRPPTSGGRARRGRGRAAARPERAPALAAQLQLDRLAPRRHAGGPRVRGRPRRSARAAAGRAARAGRRRRVEESSIVAVTSSPSSARSRSSDEPDGDLRLVPGHGRRRARAGTERRARRARRGRARGRRRARPRRAPRRPAGART